MRSDNWNYTTTTGDRMKIRLNKVLQTTQMTHKQ